ncbi:transmembrane protein 138-like isoform X2 [Vanacampus margaritifer]
MLFNTYVFQVGLVAILLQRFRALLMLSALYLTFSVILHSWLMNLRWLNTTRFIWTDGLQVLFVFQRAVKARDRKLEPHQCQLCTAFLFMTRM